MIRLFMDYEKTRKQENYAKIIFWLATVTAYPTIDLEKEEKVMRFQVYPYRNGWGNNKYNIEISSDKKKWSTGVDMSKNTKRAGANGIYTVIKSQCLPAFATAMFI